MSSSSSHHSPAAAKFDLDGLFSEEKRRREQSQRLYATVLEQAYGRIRHVNYLNKQLTATKFVVPRVVIGTTRYLWNECVAFIVAQLGADGFVVHVHQRYTIVISWAHWIPAHEREKFMLTTGSSIDGNGNVLFQSGASTGAGGGATDQRAASPPSQKTVKAASALKFRPQVGASGSVYSEDLIESTFA